MRYRFLFLLSLLICCNLHSGAGTIYSFEDGLVPSVFKARRGTLTINSEKAKLGSHALQWNWVANDTLVAAPLSMNTASIQVNGGITTWIYNEIPSDQKLILWFYEYETSTTRRCSLQVQLNFKGWRCIWARFRADMGHTGYTLRSMKWESPKTGSGTILIDYLEFVNEVSWERISDMQYSVNNVSSELEDFKTIRNTKAPAAPSSITEAQRTAVQQIRKKIDEWHLGSGKYDNNSIMISRKNGINSYVQFALNKTGDIVLSNLPDGNVKGEGLFPMDFYGMTVDGVATKTFREINEKFLIQLAYDALKNNKSASRDLILKIFDWYYDQGWADGSALGRIRFEMLRSAGFFHAAFLMRDAMTDIQFAKVMDAMNWYSMFGKAYETPVDKGASSDQIRTLLLPKLFYAISMKDELQQAVALESLVKYANNALTPAPGFLDCIKPDYSGYHHRGPYFNAYYPDALYAGSLLCYLLSGTVYALSDETFNHLKNALLTFGFICSGYDTPGAITGRFPAQTELLDQMLPAFAYVSLSRPSPDPELTSFFKNKWKPTTEPLKTYISKARTDITFKSTPGEVEKMIELAESEIPAAPDPIGSKFLPYSGLLVSRQPDWVLTVKGFSKYIWDFESSSTENLYGRYLSYGHLELSKLSQSVKSYRPSNSAWDWSHIPGTTVKYLTKTELNSQNHPDLYRNFSDEPFLGGIAFNKKVSVFANILHDNTFDTGFSARKSVFQFDSIYTCLGSGIKNTDRNYFVHTTLFQNQLINSNDAVIVNGNIISTSVSGLTNPVLKDNYGNAYIVKDGTVTLDFSTSFITGYINHGRVLTAGQYAYQMVTGVSDIDLNAISSTENPPIMIERNDESAQIVTNQADKTTAAVIYDPSVVINTGKLNKVNIPCIIVMQQRGDSLELGFTDPDMHRPSAANISLLSTSDIRTDGEFSTLQIDLNGDYEPLSNENGISVFSEREGITSVRCSIMKDGQTFRAFLHSTATALQQPASGENSAFRIFNTGSSTYKVEATNNSKFDYKIFDITGNSMSGQRNLQASATINLSSYPVGVYILKLKSEKDEKCIQLFRL